jgi:hypothetical protein
MTNATSEVSGVQLGNGNGSSDTGLDEADRRRLVGVLIGGRKRRELRALLIGELLRSRGEEADDKDEDDGDGADLEHKLLGFVIGRGLRRGRLRRMLLAELIRSRGEESEDEDEDEDEGRAEGDGGGMERKLLGFVIGRGLRRRRLRQMLLAELIRSRGEESADEDEDEDDGRDESDGGSMERKLLAFVIGRGMRRRRLRRMLIAQLIRSRGEESDEESEDEDSDGGGVERKLLGFMIGRGMRRRRLRRMLIAKLIHSRGEESDDESEDDDSDDVSGASHEERLVRLLIGGRIVRRTKMRRMLLGQLLRS